MSDEKLLRVCDELNYGHGDARASWRTQDWQMDLKLVEHIIVNERHLQVSWAYQDVIDHPVRLRYNGRAGSVLEIQGSKAEVWWDDGVISHVLLAAAEVIDGDDPDYLPA